MSKGDIIVGIDVGSFKVRTVIVQIFPNEELPRVIGVGVSLATGIRRGMITDLEEAMRSISDSVDQAERSSGVTVDKAIVSIGGNHISSQNSKGVIAVGRADGEVEDGDI